jgi:hypothetical protein
VDVTYDPRADLILGVAGPARTAAGNGTFVELRPFGATWALSCAVSASGHGFNGGSFVVVPAAELGRLADLRVPVSLEAVVRESYGLVLGSSPVRLTLEVRTSSVIELRP